MDTGEGTCCDPLDLEEEGAGFWGLGAEPVADGSGPLPLVAVEGVGNGEFSVTVVTGRAVVRSSKQFLGQFTRENALCRLT